MTGGLVVLLVLACLLPPAFGLSRHTVTDGAMSGDIETGSAVFVRSRPVVDLEVGDVISFPRASTAGVELVRRRIAEIDDGRIWTRSDRTGVRDPWPVTFEEESKARAVVDVPLVGHAYDALVGGATSLWWTLSSLG